MKKSISIIIILVLLFGGMIFFLTKKANPDIEETTLPDVQTKDTTGTISELADGWSRYRNEELGVEFEYPSETLKVFSKDGPSDVGGIREEGSVGFLQDEAWYWQLIVSVQHPTFDTLAEWFAWREKQVGYEVYLESETQIDGQKALVTYVAQEKGGYVEPFETRERKTVFFKEGVLYNINTRLPYEEVERIWRTFTPLPTASLKERKP